MNHAVMRALATLLSPRANKEFVSPVLTILNGVTNLAEGPAGREKVALTRCHRPWRQQCLSFFNVVCGLLACLVAIAGPIDGARANEDAASDESQAHKYTNRLIDSNDPYLLLHAHNPVDWYPWGTEALAKAKRENRPIFISIGYSTCYWCHVAERTIYSDPDIAKLMNEWFVNIKVDREQRPDLDNIYMQTTRLMTGRGGWPNNVFLTPDLKPFYAGSYFPAADDEHGRPGFPTILRSVHEAWENRRDEVSARADAVYQSMLKAHEQTALETAAPISPADWLSQAGAAILQDFDTTHGGLGNGPAKFPQVPALDLLLAAYAISDDPHTLDAVTKTLDEMALGGIHDHLGGGFHRYSTERTWSIPHFEKMLYDNAQLLGIYVQAYRITQKPLYRQVAEDVASYLSREMKAPGGGFFAAQDAEVAGREGVSYLWRRGEIESILGRDAAKEFFEVYSLTPVSQQSSESLVAGDDEGVLRIRVPIIQTLHNGLGEDISRVLTALAPARARLLDARNSRTQPARDEKIVVAWNGMAIEALVQGGIVFQDEHLIGLARQAADRLWIQAFDSGSGELKHELFGGRAQVHGYLDDYALLGIALLSLADATSETLWRERATLLTKSMLRSFAQGDTLVTSVAVSDLIIPPVDDGDHAAPSGSSAAIELLARMYAATGDQEYADAALRVVVHLSGMIQQNPSVWPSAVAAINLYPLSDGSTPDRDTESAAISVSLTGLTTAAHVHAFGTAGDAGDHDEIEVTVVIDEGYHVNANPASFDYLIPTSLSVDGVPDLQLEYPGAMLTKPLFAPDGLKVYEGSIVLRGLAPKGTLMKHVPITATLKVQACNDEVCLPPATLQFKVNLQ